MSKGKKIFMKIFLSYILFMMIPFGVTGYIYNSSIKSISNSSKMDSYNMLLQAKNVVDTRLEEVATISEYVSKNPDLIPILKYDKVLARENILEVYKFYNSLPDYKLSNSIIDKIYIVCKNSGLIIAPGSSCEYTEILHDNLFKGIPYDYDEWNDFLWNYRLPNDYLVIKDNNLNGHSNLVYLRGLPYELADSQPGALYISIKNSFFEDMLRKIDTGRQGVVFISDNEGNVIYSIKGEGSSLELEDVTMELLEDDNNFELKDYIISHIKSDMNNWTYYSIIPKKVILSQVSYIRNILIILTIIVLLTGCIIAYKLASKKAIILKRIIRYLSDVPMGDVMPLEYKDEFGYIESGVSNLISNNQGLNQKLKEQKINMENSAMRTLIFADFHDNNEFRTLVESTNMDLKDKKFIAMNISISYQEYDEGYSIEDNYGILHLTIKEMAQEVFHNQIYIIDIDYENMAVIAIFDKSFSSEQCYEAIDNLAKSVYSELLSKFNVVLKFGISLIHKSISKAHKAYEQSKQLSEFLLADEAFKDDEGITLYAKDHIPQSKLYYYPIEVELKLIQFVKYGEMNLLKDLFDEIYLENFENRDLSSSMKKQLVFAMRGTIIRSLQNTTSNDNINIMINELDTAVSIEDILYYAKKVSLEICRVIDEEKDQDSEKLKKDIFQYIEDSYADCNFSIHSLAERFDFSEHAIYQYFRENIGVPFSVILDNKRIEKACKIITKTEMPMKDIAINVGYNNDTTFRRAFKRVMGVLPSEYKKVTES